MKEGYLSIKDFAERAGVTQQAIYKRLTTSLTTFINIENGKKTINSKALELFKTNENNNVEQPLDKSLTTLLNATITLLSGQIETKDKQISEKDIQIENKDKQISEKDIQIAVLNEHLKQAQRLNENNQILIGRQQDQAKTLDEPAVIIKKSFWSKLFRKEG